MTDILKALDLIFGRSLNFGPTRQPLCWTYSPCPSVVHIQICSHGSYLVYSVDIRRVPRSESITFTRRLSSLRSCQHPLRVRVWRKSNPYLHPRSTRGTYPQVSQTRDNPYTESIGSGYRYPTVCLFTIDRSCIFYTDYICTVT